MRKMQEYSSCILFKTPQNSQIAFLAAKIREKQNLPSIQGATAGGWRGTGRDRDDRVHSDGILIQKASFVFGNCRKTTVCILESVHFAKSSNKRNSMIRRHFKRSPGKRQVQARTPFLHISISEN